MLDADRDFLPPFKAKTAQAGYIGLGKLIDAREESREAVSPLAQKGAEAQQQINQERQNEK